MEPSVLFFCRNDDSDAAFHEACQLQSELDIVGDEFMLGEMDLLGCYDMPNLEMLSRRAAELENTVISTIESNGGQNQAL